MPETPPPVASVDIVLADLVRAYLSTEDSIAAGLPTNEAAPRVPNWTNQKTALPCFVVSAATEEQGGPRRRVTVTVAVHWQTPAEGEPEVRETVAGWVDALVMRLREHGDLYAAIAALPVEKRTGWNLRRVWMPRAPGAEARIKDTRAALVPVSIAFDIRS